MAEVDARFAAARAQGRAARAAAPCPGCGSVPAQTPGKRVRVYCGDACRKRAQRAAQRRPTDLDGPHSAAPNPDGRLGTTGETTDTQVTGGFSRPADPKADTVTDGRDGRHRLREALYEITSDKALSGCGRWAVAGGVSVRTLASGTSYIAGVATCGKVHLCPCCGAKIRQARTVELQAAGTAWEDVGGLHSPQLLAARAVWAKPADDWTPEDHAAVDLADGKQAGGLAMLTLTMRHYAKQSLRELVTHQREAWKRSLGQNAGRDWRAAKREFGVVGFVRAWEVTHGAANGWHPHWHVLVVFEQPLTPEQGEALEEVIYGAWSSALQAVGAYLPDREHGVRLDLSGHGEGGALARYLMKFQDGKTGWSTAAEMTRQDVKVGRDGHRTPFEIVRTLSGTDQEIASDLALWREYEAAARGMRALYWSNGLRKRLGALVELDDRTDGEIAAEERNGEPIAVIPAETWHDHVVRHRGRSLALLRAAESGGVVALRDLVESWGLVWGRDVLNPPPTEPPPPAHLAHARA